MEKITAEAIVKRLRETIEIEAHAVKKAMLKVNDDWVMAVKAILSSKGRVVVMGMGKSGHIGRKIAATLASTGTPAMFVHPAEASHGDLGMVLKEDIVLAISNSGESEELTKILPVFKRLGVQIIAITAHVDSILGQHAQWILESGVEKEACPLNLAPTASTTVQLAIGDALAVALLDARGFKEDDFARSHPGGSLGKRLLTYVKDVMRSGDDVPKTSIHAPLKEALLEISKKRLGMTVIVDESNHVLGIFTDGDLRRLLEKTLDLESVQLKDVITKNPKTTSKNILVAQAVEMMERFRINHLIVVDENGHVEGALNLHDLLASKII